MPTAANSLNISGTGIQSFDGTATFAGRTISAGTGISISNGNGVSGNPTITATFGGMAWVDTTGSTQQMAPNTGYTADDGASLITFTLPTNDTQGNVMIIMGKGSGLFTVVYTTSQFIVFGKTTSTTTTGNIASNLASDCVTLRCLTTSASAPTYEVLASQGTFAVT